jgi:dihydrofolate reductase
LLRALRRVNLSTEVSKCWCGLSALPEGHARDFFVNDGPERGLEPARESAGSRDIRIAGGADVIQQYLNLGVVDELEFALAPVLFGGGRRLFENLREPVPQFRIEKVLDGPAATHLRYVRQ